MFADELQDANVDTMIVRSIKTWDGNKVIGSIVVFRKWNNTCIYDIRINGETTGINDWIETEDEMPKDVKMLKVIYELASKIGYDVRWHGGRDWRVLHKLLK